MSDQNFKIGQELAASAIRHLAGIGVILSSLLFLTLAGGACQDKKTADKEITPEDSGVGTVSDQDLTTRGGWLSSRFKNPLGVAETMSLANLKSGISSNAPINMTYSQSSQPIALFQAGEGVDSASGEFTADLPFIAFFIEKNSRVSIRHVKSLNGQNISSQVIIPKSCPQKFLDLVTNEKIQESAALADDQVLTKDNADILCVPFLNSQITDFLVPTDKDGAYLHEFTITAKNGNKKTLSVSMSANIAVVIPASSLTLKESSSLSALSIEDRLTIATNDLLGAPRRDFPLFTLQGALGPGAPTSWRIEFSNLLVSITEEVFFELPVIVGSKPAKPLISRGGRFYKRTTAINSADHFRLRIFNANNEENVYDKINSKGTSIINIPISLEDSVKPLSLIISPDFGSEQASLLMSEYVKPFPPTFCPREEAAFKPEEWRQSAKDKDYVACEALTRQRIAGAVDRAAKGLVSTMETFFGAFSYLPQMTGGVLGGTHGVLSTRISISGNVVVSVQNPHNMATYTKVGELPISYTYQLPTVLSEMQKLISTGRATPGMDSMLTSMQKNGILELPRRTIDGKSIPSFPFLGTESDSLMH
jgi:hypothetical protein